MPTWWMLRPTPPVDLRNAKREPQGSLSSFNLVAGLFSGEDCPFLDCPCGNRFLQKLIHLGPAHHVPLQERSRKSIEQVAIALQEFA